MNNFKTLYEGATTIYLHFRDYNLRQTLRSMTQTETFIKSQLFIIHNCQNQQTMFLCIYQSIYTYIIYYKIKKYLEWNKKNVEENIAFKN